MSKQPLYPSTKPPQVAEMSRNDINALANVKAVGIRQDLQWVEELIGCCEQKNKYAISFIPDGAENNIFNDEELKNMPMAYDVRENSTWCCRFCCANRRAFTIGLFPSGIPQNPKWPESEPVLYLERPFKCTIWCGTLCNPQQINVSAKGRPLGHIEQECRCFDQVCLCTGWARGFDTAGNSKYTFETALCGSLLSFIILEDRFAGKNCCAPSCLNRVFTIPIYAANDETKPIGMFKNIWPGCNWRGVCSQSASNYVVVFPTNATPEDKALLLGSLFLHDFLFFEKENDQNDNA